MSERVTCPICGGRGEVKRANFSGGLSMQGCRECKGSGYLPPLAEDLQAEVNALRAENKRLRDALYHAVYRNHEPKDFCAGCKEVSRALSGGDRGD